MREMFVGLIVLIVGRLKQIIIQKFPYRLSYEPETFKISIFCVAKFQFYDNLNKSQYHQKDIYDRMAQASVEGENVCISSRGKRIVSTTNLPVDEKIISATLPHQSTFSLSKAHVKLRVSIFRIGIRRQVTHGVFLSMNGFCIYFIHKSLFSF